MNRLFWLTIIFSVQVCFSQSPSSTPSIIKHLLEQQQVVPVIKGKFKDLLPSKYLPVQLQNEDQFLVHTQTGLFLGIDGTGIIYKLKDSANALSFKRIDSTFFWGHNFSASNFSIDNTIYSFGGYGFWNSNGLLRYYNSNINQWETIKLNKEIFSDNTHNFWVDQKLNQLYLVNTPRTNNGLHSSNPMENSPKVLFVLNIENGEWNELGVLKYTNSDWLTTDIGSLGVENSSYFLNDFVSNKKYVPNSETEKKMAKFKNMRSTSIVYFVDTTLYFGNPILNTFDSIHLTMNDFIETGEPVYISNNFFSVVFTKTNVLAGVVVLLFLAIVILAFKRLIKRKKVHSNGIAFKTNGHPQNHVFTEIEKQFIGYLYKKAIKELSVSKTEINKILGLSEKNESIQKKNRSEAINNINQKWAVLHGPTPLLIDRHRTEFDNRSFEYFIQPTWLNFVESAIS